MAEEKKPLLDKTEEKFKPVGPPPLDQSDKKNYKFVEPPGISKWMISFAKKSLVCALVYSIGYFQISVGWLVGPIVLLVVRDQWRRHHDAQRRLAQAAARGDEREIVLARLGDNLPSWVVFPDVERAEWLNQMIKQLWPRINHFTYDLVLNTIEPVLRDTLATSYKLNSFKFEKIILGETPVRVRGVKVYDEKKTDRNEIIMDLDIIYTGDCDFRFSLAKIHAGIKDLQLSGILRLVMKPLINQIPLVGGVQYFFLNPPSLDFNLIGMADVFDMPGLSDLIRRIVQEQICSMCVLPNKMFIQLAENVNSRDALAVRPEGVIRICAIEAQDLMKKDVGILGTGKSDPYVILSVGAQQHRSKTILNNVNPKWEFYCESLLISADTRVGIEVWDYDADLGLFGLFQIQGFPGVLNDDFLGRYTVDLGVVRREGKLDTWLELEDVKKGRIHLRLTWLDFSDNPADLKNSLIDSQTIGLASCMVTVRLDSAKNLPVLEKKASVMSGLSFKHTQTKVNSGGSKPDPYAILSVGKVQYESITLEKTVDPVFEETFHFLVRNPLTDTLLVKMMDKKSSTELGALKLSLDSVYHRSDMKLEKQNFSLNNREAKVTLDVQIKVLKFGVSSSAEEEVDKGEGPSLSPSPSAASRERSPLIEENKESGRRSKEPTPMKEEKGDGDSLISSSSTHRLSSAVQSLNDMKIRLTLRYSQSSQQLVVVVHSLSNLPIEKDELPDPFVKLYILPEKSKKHKTETQKDQCNPLFDERFEFPIVDLRGKTLHVQVCDKKFIRSSPKIAEAYIALDEFQSGNTLTTSYPLIP